LALSVEARPFLDAAARLRDALARGRDELRGREPPDEGLRDDELRVVRFDDEFLVVRFADAFLPCCEPRRWVDVFVCAIPSSLLGSTSSL
jgi:hypothetical protein